MREILFRGKSKIGEWFEGYYIAGVFCGEFVCFIKYEARDTEGQMHSYTVDVIPETVGQFTGITDRNGKKIFEGDIIRLNNSTEVFYIDFDESCWECKSVKYKYFTHRLENFPKKYEVVGNIHDNPELLEVKND